MESSHPILDNTAEKKVFSLYQLNKSIKNTDYWVSYSYLDSERNYRNYPMEAQPNFASTHNLSVVGKYFIDNSSKITQQL